MTDASTSLDMSTGLRKVAVRAKREPAARFHSLAHLIDEELLARAFARLRSDAAVGVDGITKEQYGQDLQNKLRDLHERLKTMRYRHQPIRRVHIPKEKKGQTRPIGISATEDKVVQNALREVLEAVYEQTFMDCSYGFRPGRSAHDAVRALTRAVNEGEANWILEFDVVSFFDSVRRSQLLEILQERVADGSLLRLIGKCLHVGVLDGEEFTEPSEGTVQGSTLSPMLGNVYLHTVLDRWFAEEVRPRLRGKATFIRFADDGVFGFERQDDAERVQAVLSKRMERFGLTLHPAGFSQTLTVARRRQESDDVRFPRVLLVLAANPRGKLGSDVQDPACKAGAGHTASACMVSRQSALAGPAAARHAREKSAGSHQLLRGERKHPQPEALWASGETELVQVAQPP